jgi:hypothetical protein
MKAYKTSEGPGYPREDIEKAIEALPDPDRMGEVDLVKHGCLLKDDVMRCYRGGIEFRLVPTIDRHPHDGETYWRWELVGRVLP